MKKILNFIKKIVIALIILYSVNLITNSSGILLPINALSIGLVTFLGLPAIFGLFILKIFVL